jgi:hypothetical protein
MGGKSLLRRGNQQARATSFPMIDDSLPTKTPIDPIHDPIDSSEDITERLKMNFFTI